MTPKYRSAFSTLANSLRFRHKLYQLTLWLGVIALLAFLLHNANRNLVEQGVATGFDFLHSATGFDIASSLISYDASSSYGRLFIVALLNTLLISVLSIVFATIIGFSIGIMRLTKHPIIAGIATVYVETLRNIPLLLQVFFWYFAVLQPLPSPRQSLEWFDSVFLNNRGLHIPSLEFDGHYGAFIITVIFVYAAITYYLNRARRYRVNMGHQRHLGWWLQRLLPLALLLGVSYWLTGIQWHWQLPELRGFNFSGGGVVTPEFFALFLALSTYTGAYIAENVRSGLLSVDKGQIEAARAIGLRPWQTLRLVIIPNAMRVIIPPLTNQYLTLTKNSSLAAAIAYPDIVLVFAGTALNQTGQAVEILLMVMLVYLFLSLVIALLMNAYNRRFLLVGR